MYILSFSNPYSVTNSLTATFFIFSNTINEKTKKHTHIKAIGTINVNSVKSTDNLVIPISHNILLKSFSENSTLKTEPIIEPITATTKNRIANWSLKENDVNPIALYMPMSVFLLQKLLSIPLKLQQVLPLYHKLPLKYSVPPYLTQLKD